MDLFRTKHYRCRVWLEELTDEEVEQLFQHNNTPDHLIELDDGLELSEKIIAHLHSIAARGLVRHEQVLRLYLDGLNQQEIAETLGVPDHRVENSMRFMKRVIRRSNIRPPWREG